MGCDIHFVVLMVLGMWCVYSLVVGSFDGGMDRCKYKSVISRINLPYVIGCELWRDRSGK